MQNPSITNVLIAAAIVRSWRCFCCSWLSGLGLGVYVDDFHQRGLTHMSHLQHYTVDVSSPFVFSS